MKNNYKFYDTSSLLKNPKGLFDDCEHWAISSITLEELEDIKSSNHKTEEIKAKARKIVRQLTQHWEKVNVIYYEDHMETLLGKLGEGFLTNDLCILACAIWYEKELHPDDVSFVTNDLCLRFFANRFFGNDSIESVIEITENYTGYKDITFSDEALSDLYTIGKNIYDLKINEYLIVRDKNGTIVDRLKWTDSGFKNLANRKKNFNSIAFGDIKPYNNDIYQSFAMDSLQNNQVTMLKGPAGSGKSLLSLGYLMAQLDQRKIDKIIIFCNTVATKNSARLGFYPGTRDEKLLDSQIGNFLSSKLGSRYAVEQMIQKEQLVLLPLSDIRGYDTTGMRAGIYITEAQNLDIELMKLALQRIGEDSICIIDGDCEAQVDDISFSGERNGMKRLSKVFRGSDIYGEFELSNIYRSKIANLAQQR